MDELKTLLGKLGVSASDVVRRNEAYFIAHLQGKDFSKAEWLEILTTHPELLERPIVVNGDKAVIARPAERLHEIL